ncbi:methyl-accepting chemotaxis sensory transducer with Pas/Pac sensor [Desulfonatronospira thiodismutans ASO3-1]|uniref:Methyl-accepting chemotaxis sensory transducer with Pas/Pac sensor n=1 Tax=Desulfonatronospira thiodismutans ASO3-1 TaxID=555779 RepID=D6SLI9_9BACT|nr:methyl-accepting chemotaxis protein [Desulfonatronospira thiodismutans]EFI35550.1 methyl-accepting chemotaxis sensory transducer with Pas/Pac sensor [Desulfonatronospira thiodismutans ASO3-1]
MRFTIFWKILAILGSTIVLVSAAIFLTTNHFVTQSLDEQALDTLDNYRQAVDMEIEEISSNAAFVNSVVVENPDVAEAIKQGDSEFLHDYGNELTQAQHIGFIAFTNAEGDVVARGHIEEKGDNIQHHYIVQQVLRGDSITGIEHGEHISLSIRSGEPVKKDGEVVGAVVMGESFETHAFVDRIEQKLGVDATIFEDDTRISTSIRDEAGDRLVGTQMEDPEVIRTVIQDNEIFWATNPVQGVMYDTIYWPIEDVQGEIVGMYFLGQPRDVIEGIQASVLNSILAVTAVVGALMLAVGAFFARRLGGSVSRAAGFASMIARGDMDKPLEIKSRDETGQLAESLNEVRDNVTRLIKDTEHMAESIRHGDIRAVLPVEQYEGAYSKLAKDINNASEIVAGYLEVVPSPIVTMDKDFNILWMNKTGVDLFGGNRSDVEGEKCYDMFRTQDCQTEACACTQAMKTGSERTNETRAYPGDMQLDISYTGRPIKDNQGRVVGAIEFVTDLTQVKASQRKMQEVAQRAASVSDSVSSASDELSAQVEQASRGTEEQTNRIGETATSMEEMNATVLEVARNASGAAEQTDMARAKAQEGAGVVKQSVEAINEVQEQSKAMKDNLASLGKQSEEIGKVMTVIDDIADQTNLLALNAAIEAARAGDAGRGFAVVADEVRKLAEKTMNATKEVEKTVTSIQESTKSNMDSMDQSVQAVEKATQLANSSGQALQEIVSLAQEAADQVRSIATASEEQSSASEEVNKSMEDVNRIARETADAMNQSAQAVSDLAKQAGELQKIIEDLRKA